jgi:hypothetical protein
MGLMNWLGLESVKDLSEPIKAVGDLYTTDKARIQAETEMQKVMVQPVLEQQKVNAVLAASSQVFNSGWQPLIGWTAGFLILLYWGPQLVFANMLWIRVCLERQVIMPFPIAPDEIMNLIYLVFGFGGYTLVKNKMSG